MPPHDALLAPVDGAQRREIGGITVDTVQIGEARVKRLIYPAGFRWSTHIKPLVGTELCTHAHVGFLTRGEIHVLYGDGCTLKFVAPQAVAIEPGHDAWVEGDGPAILIEVDFESATLQKFGMPGEHRHV